MRASPPCPLHEARKCRRCGGSGVER
jgi:hypothetical protein